MAFAKLGDSERAWDVLNMINPVNHANSAAAIAIYKAEPYVVAADVYAVRRMLAGAVGVGTPAQPAGCIG